MSVSGISAAKAAEHFPQRLLGEVGNPEVTPRVGLQKYFPGHCSRVKT